MTRRGTPGQWSALHIPDRALRVAARAYCEGCREHVLVRGGVLAGHYAAGDIMCPGAGRAAPPTSDARRAGAG